MCIRDRGFVLLEGGGVVVDVVVDGGIFRLLLADDIILLEGKEESRGVGARKRNKGNRRQLLIMNGDG